jgi:hypothetical protein
MLTSCSVGPTGPTALIECARFGHCRAGTSWLPGSRRSEEATNNDEHCTAQADPSRLGRTVRLPTRAGSSRFAARSSRSLTSQRRADRRGSSRIGHSGRSGRGAGVFPDQPPRHPSTYCPQPSRFETSDASAGSCHKDRENWPTRSTAVGPATGPRTACRRGPAATSSIGVCLPSLGSWERLRHGVAVRGSGTGQSGRGVRHAA